ncbi:MAG TPA: hybrid sensor histidine kinase/response regulator [bacterium]|nr:hybrid sensor histidine kinase/response regulator [bacterium]
MDDKRKKYLKIFRAEAEEHISAINNGLVLVEQGKHSAEVIHDILRASHTLKGSARMLGLEEIGDIGHKMEDIMKAVESGELVPSPEVVDRLLEGADCIAKLLEPDVELATVDSKAVIARLVSAMQKQAPAPEPPPKEGKPKKFRDKAREPEPKKAETTTPSSGPGQAPDEKTAPPAESAEPAPAAKQKSDTLRVQASRLDNLIDYSGELLINRIKLETKTFSAKSILMTLTDLINGFEALTQNGGRSAAKQKLQELRNFCHEFVQEFIEDVIELGVNVQEIQSSALQLRMTPASDLFDEFPRLVRDLARDMNKEIRLEIRGEDTELDKRLLEQLRGPLIHLIRNCCDHGIEPPAAREARGKPRQGAITVQAYHQGSSVLIEVGDDGAGMDAARIREVAVARGIIDERAARELTDDEAYYLTLRPGFSTSKLITDISGRGVGLDVVKTNVEALRGDLAVRSVPGKGAVIEMRLPHTVSIIEALIIVQGGDVYAIPLTAVEEVARITVKDLVMDRGREAVTIRGRLLSLVRLSDLLGLAPLKGDEVELKSAEDMITAVVLRFRNQRLALQVDKAIREQEVLVKSLGAQLARAPLLSGATILRKGEPALILNVFDIFAEAGRIEGKGILEMIAAREKQERPPRVLVVDDSITTRTIEKNILEREGYEVVTAVSGEEALVEVERSDPMFDVFVVDVDMPGIDGFDLTERLRAGAKTKAIPVIIVTSRTSDEDKRRGIAVGAQAYIVKGSFDQNVLLDTVKSLIGE